jgi:TRAP-type mannitol/chloroaromatic compound transport system permease small subunit
MQTETAFDRILGALIIASNNVGSLLILAMTLAVVADVSGRYLFSAPINGTAEMVTMAVVAILYMQLPYTLRSGRLTRSDAFYNKLLQRRPKVGNAVGMLYNLAGAALALAIMLNAWPKWITAWQSGFYVGVIGVFTFPEWPLLLVIFVGCALTGLQFLLLAARNLHVLRGRTSQI